MSKKSDRKKVKVKSGRDIARETGKEKIKRRKKK